MKKRKKTERTEVVHRVTIICARAICISAIHWLAIIVLVFASATVNHLSAQCASENKAFKAGEKIDYDLYFNWAFIWKKVGTATMSIDSDEYKGIPSYRIDLISRGSKQADIFFKMRDTLVCYITKKLEPLYFKKAAEEGKRYTVDEAWFDYVDSKVNVHQKRTWLKEPVELSDYTSEHCVFDMLSILAQARSFNPNSFKIGSRVHFPMTTGKRVENEILIYRGKKVIKANDGYKYRCMIFSFVEKERNKETEVITFYVTDDENHLPIRLDMFLNFGSAKAFLKGVENNRHPLSSRL